MKKLFILLALTISIVSVNAQNIQQIQGKADGGDAYSQYLMGYSYNNGVNGVTKNLAQARLWFEKSANNGFAGAAYFMGWYYYCGEGVEKDMYEALKWFTKASNLGMVEAESMIAVCKSNVSYAVSSFDSSSIEIDDFDPSNPPIL